MAEQESQKAILPTNAFADATSVAHDMEVLPPPSTPDQESDTPPTTKRVDFWVSPPLLDSSEKDLYRPAADLEIEVDFVEEEDESPMEIVNEIRLGTDLYYWIRGRNSIIYRRLAKDIISLYPALVNGFKLRKERGLLKEIDPNSPRIHPKDRLNLKAAGRATRSTHTSEARVAKSKRPIIFNSSEEDDTQSEGDFNEDETENDDFDGSESSVEPTRRSVRTSGKKKNVYREISPSSVKGRINSRHRAAAVKRRGKYAETDDDYGDDEDNDNDEPQPKEKMPKGAIRGRLSRPAYGNIRGVADLSDNDSEDGEAAFHAHRSTCDKCQQPPAHELLNKFYKKGKKKSRARKLDEFEEEDDEEQRLLNLGGWVRCIKCCVTSHWRCLTRAQRDDILKAAKIKEKEAEAEGLKPRKREMLEAYDTTDFYCNGCISGSICMYCHETAIRPEDLPSLKAQAGNTMETSKEAPSSVDIIPFVPPTNSTDKKMMTPPPTLMVTAPTPTGETNSVNGGKNNELEKFSDVDASKTRTLLFRCATCKRLAHYEHLPQPDPNEPLSPAELAEHYQTENDWKCSDCVSFVYQLDKIIAWRPYPAGVVEPLKSGEVLNYKQRLPREYLVKWIDRSYRRLQWVPHMWLLSTSPAKLKNFLSTGPKVRLLDEPREELFQRDPTTAAASKEATPSFLAIEDDSARASAHPESQNGEGPSPPLPDAEKWIPLSWQTVDRILDVRIWDPMARIRAKRKKMVKKHQLSNRKLLESDPEVETDPEESENIAAEKMAARVHGEEPSSDLMETIEDWEIRMNKRLTLEKASDIIWAYIKWEDLPYDEATWDCPPSPSQPGYRAFEKAFQRYLNSRDVCITVRNKQAGKQFDDRRKRDWLTIKLDSDPDLGQEGKLMDFQLIGVNWLLRNWWEHQPSILADEMGLGKTVQIAMFVGHVIKTFETTPVLIVVPNPTITNWIREFARWAPRLRVVPFYGEAKAREVIKDYELYHDTAPKGFSNLKFHVLITTYDTLTGKDFSSIFKKVSRWELLIVDEGQRLKSDSSVLFKRMNELNSIQRILMTGTPLNNNIRELFNLMNFLEPEKWNDLKALEKQYEVLTEDLLTNLHDRLKPYFLRRTKADVLKLPPKNEVIVPVSMTGIQKEVYKSILSQNLELLGKLTQPSSRVNTVVKNSNMRNVLMQLRKCLQHPYLISHELEPNGADLTQEIIHKNLVEASAKLQLLQKMLPKLKAKGHRILLFSQFTMALDIIEDFVKGEGYKFLRLDGNVKQDQRQKDMDAFNRPDSDIFIYMLSTRAGGVGINLWSADTVIIFDPDFNPHQDLQAISRAHRYGQVKTVLVFKLMVKGAAEERIIQAGKKKLVLDHLIVQKMDEEGVSDDVQSILTFGAKALFDNEEANDINYTDADIDKLIDRTEKEGDQVEEVVSAFNFAKLWVVEKDAMEEVSEEPANESYDSGFWDAILERAAKEKAKENEEEISGSRPKRRAVAVVQKYVYDDGLPEKSPRKKRHKASEDSDNAVYQTDSESESTSYRSTQSQLVPSDNDLQPPSMTNANEVLSLTPATVKTSIPEKSPAFTQALASVENRKSSQKRPLDNSSDDERICGLCHSVHGPGECYMTQNPAHLLEYRTMLFTESTEPIERRRLAVQAIDERLVSRGLSHLVKNLGPFPDTREASSGKRKYKIKQGNLLKRPPPSSSRKKIKTSGPVLKCAICDGPFHFVEACPVIKQGPESITNAVNRLSQDPQHVSTVNILRSLLHKK